MSRVCNQCEEERETAYCPECGSETVDLMSDSCPECGAELDEHLLAGGIGCEECGYGADDPNEPVY